MMMTRDKLSDMVREMRYIKFKEGMTAAIPGRPMPESTTRTINLGCDLVIGEINSEPFDIDSVMRNFQSECLVNFVELG